MTAVAMSTRGAILGSLQIDLVANIRVRVYAKSLAYHLILNYSFTSIMLTPRKVKVHRDTTRGEICGGSCSKHHQRYDQQH